MSAKRSPAARVLEFFSTAPIGEANLMAALVKEVMHKRRQTEAVGTGMVIGAVKKRVRRAKVNARPIGAAPGVTSVSTATPAHPREV